MRPIMIDGQIQNPEAFFAAVNQVYGPPGGRFPPPAAPSLNQQSISDIAYLGPPGVRPPQRQWPPGLGGNLPPGHGGPIPGRGRPESWDELLARFQEMIRHGATVAPDPDSTAAAAKMYSEIAKLIAARQKMKDKAMGLPGQFRGLRG